MQAAESLPTVEAEWREPSGMTFNTGRLAPFRFDFSSLQVSFFFPSTLIFLPQQISFRSATCDPS
jgi:hypothetical protein